MDSSKKKVSKKYVKRQFYTIGLVLIVYCLFVLYIPLFLNKAWTLLNIPFLKIFDSPILRQNICLIVGTIIPFSLLSITSKDNIKDFNNKTEISFVEHLINFIVFFFCGAALMFVTMMLAQYINVSGQLVSSIGITFNSEYLNDIFYVISFIVITPILEEYAFRGVLLKCLSKYGKYFAVIASSLIYALAHGSFVEMIPSFFMGLILSKKVLYYKSIKPTVIMHILFNASLFLMLIASEHYSLYVVIALTVMLILAFILLATKKYHFIKIKKSDTNSRVGLLFLSTPTIVFTLILFIGHSILLFFF